MFQNYRPDNQLWYILSFFLAALVVTLLLSFIAWCIMNKRSSRRKLTPYECGFEPSNDARQPVYTNFYLVGLLFLLFDVELILLLPAIMSFSILTVTGIYTFLFFVSMIWVGYIYETLDGAIGIRERGTVNEEKEDLKIYSKRDLEQE